MLGHLRALDDVLSIPRWASGNEYASVHLRGSLAQPTAPKAAKSLQNFSNAAGL
jgi:hypothetical protein